MRLPFGRWASSSACCYGGWNADFLRLITLWSVVTKRCTRPVREDVWFGSVLPFGASPTCRYASVIADFPFGPHVREFLTPTVAGSISSSLAARFFISCQAASVGCRPAKGFRRSPEHQGFCRRTTYRPFTASGPSSRVTAPFGHCTSMASTKFAAPRPKCATGSS